MQLKELIHAIETFAPPGLALEWDNSGIQVAGTRQKIKSLALALDPDEITIQKAISLKTDFLLTHHPLVLKPRLPDRPDSFHKIIKNLLTTDTILYSAHTSLDVNPQGPVRWLAKELNLKNTTVLEPLFTRKALKISFQQPLSLSPEEIPLPEHILDSGRDAQNLLSHIILFQDKADLFISRLKDVVWPFYLIATECPDFNLQCGLGFTGILPEPVSFEEFVRTLKNILDIKDIIQTGDSPAIVDVVSCCPGSGGEMSAKAFKSGARVFITGDLKYHQAREASGYGCVLDPGHFILEEKMMFRWFLELKQLLDDIDIYFIEGTPPFKTLG